MQRSELEHIIRAASAVTKERDFIIVGSQAILGSKPDAPRTLRRSMEADIYPKDKPELADLINGNIGELTHFHDTHGYYAHGIEPEVLVLAKGWQERLIPVTNENTQGATGWCLDVHDLAFSKLAAGREKDLEFVAEMRKHHMLKSAKIESLLQASPENLSEIMKARWKRISQIAPQEKGLGQQALENFKTQAKPGRDLDDNTRSL